MLKKIAALTVVVTIVSLSNTARADGWTYSTPNVFGGQNYDFGGKTGYTTPNVFGGWNWFSR